MPWRVSTRTTHKAVRYPPTTQSLNRRPILANIQTRFMLREDTHHGRFILLEDTHHGRAKDDRAILTHTLPSTTINFMMLWLGEDFFALQQ